MSLRSTTHETLCYFWYFFALHLPITLRFCSSHIHHRSFHSFSSLPRSLCLPLPLTLLFMRMLFQSEGKVSGRGLIRQQEIRDSTGREQFVKRPRPEVIIPPPPQGRRHTSANEKLLAIDLLRAPCGYCHGKLHTEIQYEKTKVYSKIW